MRVCGCGLSKVIWITRVSRGEKKGNRIDIAKWMYVPRDWVRGPKLGTYSDWGLLSVLVINKHLSHLNRDWVCVRTRENNLLMTTSVRRVNDTN